MKKNRGYISIVFVVALSATGLAGAGQGREGEDQSFVWKGAGMARLLPALVDVGRLTDSFLQLKDELGLSPGQVEKLTAIQADQSELMSRSSVEFKLAAYHLNRVLAKPGVDMKAVESALRQKEKVRSNLDIGRMRNALRALEVLNHDQHLRALRAAQASE